MVIIREYISDFENSWKDFAATGHSKIMSRY